MNAEREKKPNYPLRRALTGVVAVVALAGACKGAQEITDEPTLGDTVVTVERGDTVWDIVKDHCPDQNIPETVYYTERFNEIENPGELSPGDEIRLLDSCQ